MGFTDFRIITKHILPNIMEEFKIYQPTILLNKTFEIKNMTQKITLTPDIFLSGLGKNEFIWSTSKGQLISIGLFGVFNSPKKRTKTSQPEVS